MSLLFNKTSLTRAVGHGLVLQWAFASLVTHRTVQWVVGEEKLKNAVLRLLDLVRIGRHVHAIGDADVARGLERWTAWAVDLHEAHAANANRLHAGVIAKTWHE